jgi:hypothetical protein
MLDDRQRCACAGDGEIGRRPKGSAHAGADTGAGVFRSDRVGRVVFEPLNQRRDRQRRRVGHEQVHVVGFTVELHQLDIEFDAHRTHGVLAKGEHLVGEHWAAVLGHENKVRMQQRHAMSGASVGRACQWSPLRLWRG